MADILASLRFSGEALSVANLWHLPKVDWLKTLPSSEAEAIRRASARRIHERGKPIFGPSHRPEHVYLLEEGLVRIYRTSPRGGQLTVGYVRPGEVFGEVSVITEKPRRSFAEAKNRSRVLQIPRPVFIKALQSTSTVLYEVTKKIGRRLASCQSRIEDLMFYNVPSRLARLLLRLADEFGREIEDGHSVGLPLTQSEIATLIGATRQTVSAALRELIDAGLIKRRGKELVLVNVRAISQRARLSASQH
jgi:CRP-like cAMP-binding protein